ncbi:MAG: nucleotide-binding protein [Xanthobacteraceae bacterium]|nr:nucleotide-binding protein [Xanthobacteraceae bacterium]
MSGKTSKPSIFIGSSSERLDVAYAIQESLEYDAEPTVWTQGIFEPTSNSLADLIKASRSFEFAIFIFAPDDLLLLRNEQKRAVRDNVIFELGLFIGALGSERCFLVCPRGTESVYLPTDLLGVTPLTYVADRADGNLVAALGPACNRVRRAMSAFVSGAVTRNVVTKSVTQIAQADDYLSAWEAPPLVEARKIVGNSGLFDPYDSDFEKVRPALQRIFAFFESMAEAILSGRIDEAALRQVFEKPVLELWPHLYTSLAPPNHAAEWWDPPPKISQLFTQWGAGARVGQ